MAWLAAGATLGGAAISSAGIGSANETNVGFQRDLTQHQTNMANTAHQRQVMDLRAAGLNPILSASRGAGNVPGGSTGAQNKYADAPAAAKAAALIGAEIKAINSTSAKNNADAIKAAADADLARSRKAGQDSINEKLNTISKPFVDAGKLYDSAMQELRPKLKGSYDTLKQGDAALQQLLERGSQSAKDLLERMKKSGSNPQKGDTRYGEKPKYKEFEGKKYRDLSKY